jgi:hypothetical protein
LLLRQELYFIFGSKSQRKVLTPGTETQNGIVGLVVTEDKHREVMQALSEAASSRNNTFRTIGDNITNEYLHANITSVLFVHQT